MTFYRDHDFHDRALDELAVLPLDERPLGRPSAVITTELLAGLTRPLIVTGPSPVTDAIGGGADPLLAAPPVASTPEHVSRRGITRDGS